MKAKPAIVLLVEDDEEHAVLIMRTLEEVKVKVYWVSDGEEAMDYLLHRGIYKDEEKSPRPDLILLDLRLPKLDGHEVLKEIKRSEDLKIIPVVVLTISESEADMIKAYHNHANSYLVKPLNFENFKKMMDGMSFYWLRWNQLPWRKGIGGIR